MKVIIPVAGTGKRLYPHTFTKPKPMVYIAGKPVIGHILDRMIDLEPEEIILVVGYRKEQIISYVDRNYSDIFKITYVEQNHQLGLGHSIYVAKDEVGDSPIMITLGDMIFKAGYLDFYQKHFKNGNCAGSIGVWEVDVPEKYGIVELDEECISKMVEKPKEPTSNLGIAGVYFLKEPSVLFDILEKMVNEHTENEIQLTDALQGMVSNDHRLKHFYVSSWYDCGHSTSLLETNKVLLDESHEKKQRMGLPEIQATGSCVTKECNCNLNTKDSVIIEPVSIGNGVIITNSVIGPHVSIADNSNIDGSIVANSIIGSSSSIKSVNLWSSIIGDDVNVNGKHNSFNIGDASSIEL
ncbi:NTP transferase domain-containing protein [bacterium]|nr:NTP transferase domain-containing protein [bacterium]MBI9073643.1 NTP transferase domain-containing protein [Melioribacteraceae bacterium]